jgi:hypothetical protein
MKPGNAYCVDCRKMTEHRRKSRAVTDGCGRNYYIVCDECGEKFQPAY